MRIRSILAVLALAAPLGACSGGTLTGENYHAYYQPGLVNYAAREGYMPVAVYGQPFGPDSAPQVASELRMPGGHVQVPFAATPEAQAGQDSRVVLLFSGGGAAPGGAQLCRLDAGDVPPVGDSGGNLSVMAAFCTGDGVATEVQLNTPRPSSPADPAFKNAMQVMLARLLPTRNPTIENDDPGCGAFC